MGPLKIGDNIPILLTKTQISNISKGIPFILKLSKAQVTALAKHGGFLITIPTLLAAASAIGSLAGGASAIAKTINEKKVAQKQLQETKRHNLEMEKKGKGLFLKPYPRQRKVGEGLYLKPYRK